jgi:hypothetical protein
MVLMNRETCDCALHSGGTETMDITTTFLCVFFFFFPDAKIFHVPLSSLILPKFGPQSCIASKIALHGV